MKRAFVGTSVCLIIAAVVLPGCAGQKAVQDGDTVRVAYVGTLNDGTMFDSTNTGDYIEFTVGTRQVIAGFDSAVVGMKPGETKEVVLTPDQAYGMPLAELTHEMPLSQFPDSLKASLGIGTTLNMAQPDGRQIPIRVADIKDDSIVVLDANHPLAGETLNFKLTLVEVVPKDK